MNKLKIKRYVNLIVDLDFKKKVISLLLAIFMILQVVTISVYAVGNNKKEATLTVKEMSSQDSTPLSGVELTLYRDIGEDDIVDSERTNENGIALFKHLNQGKYYLKETKQKEGYKKTDEVWTIEINSRGEKTINGKASEMASCKEIVFEEKAVDKVEASESRKVAKIEDPSSVEENDKINIDEPSDESNLEEERVADEPKKDFVKETANDTSEAEALEQGEGIDSKNNPEIFVDLTIESSKVERADESKKDLATEKANDTSDEEMLPQGEGIDLKNNPEGASDFITKNLKVVTVKFVSAEKIGEEKEVPLAGVEFELQKKENQDWISYKKEQSEKGTGAFTFKDVENGQYRLLVSKVPIGYEKTEDSLLKFTVEYGRIMKEDQTPFKDVETIYILPEPMAVIPKPAAVTQEATRYPETGGMGAFAFIVVGTSFISIAYIGLKRKDAF